MYHVSHQKIFKLTLIYRQPPVLPLLDAARASKLMNPPSFNNSRDTRFPHTLARVYGHSMTVNNRLRDKSKENN
jgi:hypothetical protein